MCATASMMLMPAWARRLAGLDHSPVLRKVWLEPSTRLNVHLIRSAYGVPGCRRLAGERVSGRTGAAPADRSGTAAA